MDYGLRYYVKDTYSKFANKRGGSSFTPVKNDKRGFITRVRYAINNALKVITITSEKYPITYN